MDKVTQHLSANGLSVVQLTPNHMLVQARGTVAQVEQAFGVNVNVYSVHEKLEFSNDREPSVPSELRGVVHSVLGLDSMSKLHSMAQGQPLAATSSGSIIYTPFQIATAYSFPNANNVYTDGAIYSGKGAKLAIVPSVSYSSTDVDFFWQYYGITRSGNLTKIPVNGGSTLVDFETTLDVEQTGAQAPGVDILVYSTPNCGAGCITFADTALAFSQAVTDNLASVVSTSFGACEQNVYLPALQSQHAAIQQGTAQGMTFFVGSGDSGIYSCNSVPGIVTNTTVAVFYPSSDPYETSVGGTNLYLSPNWMRASESTWEFSGGGASLIFSQPAWQAGPGIPTNGVRDVADVAFNASDATRFYMFYQDQWFSGFGTSFGGPNWAALWALGEEAIGGQRTGLANPFLYNLGNSMAYHPNFYDIKMGNNGAGISPGFSAGPNWDYPTGWGTPKGGNLVKSMQEYFGH
jgi:kumamolisin